MPSRIKLVIEVDDIKRLEINAFQILVLAMYLHNYSQTTLYISTSDEWNMFSNSSVQKAEIIYIQSI